MKNTRLIELFRVLSQSEMKRFAKYVYSPYFNTHKDTLRLFELIKASYPDFDSEALLSENIFSRLYPKEAFDDLKIRTLRKYLLKLLLGFLGQTQVEKDSLSFELHQFEELLARNSEKHFLHLSNQIEKRLTNRSPQNAQLLLYNYQFENLRVNYRSVFKSRWEEKGFQKAMATLDHFYLAEKLRLYCSIISEEDLFHRQNKMVFGLEEMLEYCRHHFETLPILIRVYYHMVLLSQAEKESASFLFLKQTLPVVSSEFDKYDQINIYNYLINYCYKQYKQGEATFEHEMFILYKAMLKNNLLFEEGMLSSNHYKNISSLGLRVGEYEWVKDFIEQYKGYINPKYRTSVFNYNLANYYVYQQSFEQALKHLQKVSFIDPFYRISHYILLLKIYFECEEVEPFLSLCVSFRSFLRRKKILSENQRKAYLQFVKFSKAIFLIKIGQRKNNDQLLPLIQDSSNLIEKNWLKDKLGSLS